MKKSSLKGMMSRVIIYSITVLLSSLFCWREAVAQVRAKTVCLTVTDGFSAPLYGVYVVDIRNRLLVTTTDDEGQCKILLKGFSVKDTLEFSCLGFYAKRMAVDSLHDGQVIALQERSILLEEVAAEGIHPWDLLKGISKEIKKKKEKVKGVSAKVITVSMLGGDCYPATPIGINLPNADWIRRDHGSKSVTIENITEAYDKASQGNGFNEEFVWSEKEREGLKKYGFITDNLHTDLHECLGHGSGKLLPDTDPDALKAYSSTLEEARADLFGLYYLGDAKLVELGLVPDAEAYKAEYYKYIMNGLMTQLVRIEQGKNVEEAHMRNRQLIAKWVYEKGKADNVIELKQRDGKTYVVVNDYAKLRELFGTLLAEVQRIKSEGDFSAGKKLVEEYAVKVDPALHAEVLERYAKLNLAPYKGFVNPVMKEVKNDKGDVTDIVLDYTEGYTDQMLRYSKEYSFLPSYNE